MTEYTEGFYHLTSKNESEPTLVHGYKCTDLDGEFVFGFNTHDGGSLVKASDLTSDTKVVPVFVSRNKRMNTSDAFDNLKQAIKDDDGYAISWHSNIAVMCADAMSDIGFSHEEKHVISNDAAGRFMRLCFDVDSSKILSDMHIEHIDEQITKAMDKIAAGNAIFYSNDEAKLKVKERLDRAKGGPIPESVKPSSEKEDFYASSSDGHDQLEVHQNECIADVKDYNRRLEKAKSIIDDLEMENHNLKIEIDFYKKLFRKFTNTD